MMAMPTLRPVIPCACSRRTPRPGSFPSSRIVSGLKSAGSSPAPGQRVGVEVGNRQGLSRATQVEERQVHGTAGRSSHGSLDFRSTAGNVGRRRASVRRFRDGVKTREPFGEGTSVGIGGIGAGGVGIREAEGGGGERRGARFRRRGRPPGGRVCCRQGGREDHTWEQDGAVRIRSRSGGSSVADASRVAACERCPGSGIACSGPDQVDRPGTEGRFPSSPISSEHRRAVVLRPK